MPPPLSLIVFHTSLSGFGGGKDGSHWESAPLFHRFHLGGGQHTSRFTRPSPPFSTRLAIYRSAASHYHSGSNSRCFPPLSLSLSFSGSSSPALPLLHLCRYVFFFFLRLFASLRCLRSDLFQRVRARICTRHYTHVFPSSVLHPRELTQKRTDKRANEIEARDTLRTAAHLTRTKKRKQRYIRKLKRIVFAQHM